jgi:hypothetical protein
MESPNGDSSAGRTTSNLVADVLAVAIFGVAVAVAFLLPTY